jgi:PAS domain S-box-containing protein
MHRVITADGLCGIDRYQRIVQWNEAAQRMLGYAPREVMGRCCFEVLGGVDEHGCRVCRQGCPVYAQGADRQPPLSHDILTKTKSGSDIWLTVATVLPEDGAKGDVVLFHLFRDVTHSKLLQLGVRAMLETDPSNAASTAARSSDTIMALSPSPLTAREREVLSFLAAGASTRQIAESLMVSTATVRHHVGAVLAKLHAHSRLEAVSLAHRHHLLA